MSFTLAIISVLIGFALAFAIALDRRRKLPDPFFVAFGDVPRIPHRCEALQSPTSQASQCSAGRVPPTTPAGAPYLRGWQSR